MTKGNNMAKHDNIAAALAAFQADIPSIAKSATADTGKYSYSYAPLDELVPLILPLLAKHGMAFTTVPTFRQFGEGRPEFVLYAALIHESGQKIEGDYPLVDPRTPPQQIGSAITYARRYALTALTGVAPGGEDDDGAAAQKHVETNPAPVSKPAAPKATKLETVRAEIGGWITSGKVTGEQANEVMREVTGGKEDSKWTATDFQKGRDLIKEKFSIED